MPELLVFALVSLCNTESLLVVRLFFVGFDAMSVILLTGLFLLLIALVFHVVVFISVVAFFVVLVILVSLASFSPI